MIFFPKSLTDKQGSTGYQIIQQWTFKSAKVTIKTVRITRLQYTARNIGFVRYSLMWLCEAASSPKQHLQNNKDITLTFPTLVLKHSFSTSSAV